MKRVALMLIALVGGATILTFIAGTGRRNERLASPSGAVQTVNTPGELAVAHGISPSSRRAAIENIARKQHRSVESIELEVAKAIVQARQEAKTILGNYDPGIHVVRGTDESRIEPDVLKLVPAGSLANVGKIVKDGKLRMPDRLVSDKSLYINQTSVAGTGLSDVTMIGYEVSGVYLNGNDYARTDVLRNLESTPSGRSGWTGLTRVYAGHATLGNVIFDESDFAAGQQIVLIPDNTLNSRVGPYRATLARLKSEDGTTMSDLSWFNDAGRSYSLKITQIDDRSIAQLMLLAEEIANQSQ